MPTVADLSVKFSADTAGAEAGTNKVQGLVGRLTDGVKGMATVAGGVVLGAAINNVVGSVGRLAGAGLDFEAQMANVDSVLQTSGDELNRFKDQILAISGDPRILAGPAELAAGMYDVVSSGFEGAEALTVVQQAAMAATAGMTTTDVASRAITASLNAYGLGADDARRVSDVLFKTVDSGVITFEQLANNLGNTLPLANSLGIEIESLGAAYALMTLKGVSASQAETQIAALMRSAINPTTQLTEAVNAHGFSSAEAAIQTLGFGGFLELLMDASGGSKEALADMLGTTEAVNAALILGAEDGEAYNAMLEEMEGASEGVGATQRALERQMQSSRFAIAEARKQVEILATMVMGALAPGISFAARALSSFIQEIIGFVNNLRVALGDAVLFETWLNSLPGFIQPVIVLIRDLVAAGGDLVDAFQALMAGDFSEFFDELGEAATTAWDAITELLGTVADSIIDLGSLALSAVIDFAGDLPELAARGMDWIRDRLGIPEGADFTTTLNAVISAVVGWAGDLADMVGRGISWVIEKLGFGSRGGRGSAAQQAAGVETGIDIGTLLVNGVARLGAALQEIANGVIDWLKRQLGVNESSRIPMALGTAVFNAAVQLGGLLRTVAADVFGWVREQMGIHGANRWPVEIGTVVLNATVSAVGLVNSIISELYQAIRGVDWTGILRAAMSLSFDLGTILGEKVREGIAALANLSFDDVQAFATVAAKIAAAMVAAMVILPVILAGALLAVVLAGIAGLVEGLTGVDLSAVAGAIYNRIVAAIKSFAGFASGIKDALAAEIGQAARAMASADLSVDNIASVAKDAIVTAIGALADFATGLKDAIVAKFSGMNITAGDLATWAGGVATAIWDAVKNAVRDAPGDVKDAIMNALFGEGEASPYNWAASDVPQSATLGGGALFREFTAQLKQTESAVQTAKATFAQAGTDVAQQFVTQFTTALQPLVPRAQQITQQMLTAVQAILQQLPPRAQQIAMQAQTTFIAALTPIVPQSQQIAAQTNQSVVTQLNAIVGPARAAGSAAAQGFLSGLQALSQAAGIAAGAIGALRSTLSSASAGAFGYGAAVGNQFAAGLRSSLGAVASAAAALRALMPSSPAKTGPLADPISFDYIPHALEQAMGQMGRIARGGMGDAADAFGGSARFAYAGRYAAQQPQIIVVNALKSDELLRIMRGSERGHLAYAQMQPVSRERALGLRGV